MKMSFDFGWSILILNCLLAGILADLSFDFSSEESTDENTTIVSTISTSTSSTPSSTICGHCPKKYVGNSETYVEVPLTSENVSRYSSCRQDYTECATTVTIPRGLYLVMDINIYMLSKDTLTVYDGDVSTEDEDGSERPRPLAVYGYDDTTTDHDATLESSGNQVTLVFRFRYYPNHYPLSFYKITYKGQEADCSCPQPTPWQSSAFIIESPNFPHYYCPQSSCDYYIQIDPANASTYCGANPVFGASLSFSAFDLADQDYVWIYGEEPYERWLASFPGNTKPVTVSFGSLTLKVSFRGPVAGSHTGFKATIKTACGQTSLPDETDAFHITMGTLGVLGLCVVVVLVILVVVMLTMRESRRWRRARGRRNGTRGDRTHADPSDMAISIVGPLPSYTDALHCMKFEPISPTSPSSPGVSEPPPYALSLLSLNTPANPDQINRSIDHNPDRSIDEPSTSRSCDQSDSDVPILRTPIPSILSAARLEDPSTGSSIRGENR